MKICSWLRFGGLFTTLILFLGCRSSSVREEGWTPYAATIAEGRSAVQEEMTNTKATSVSVALVDDRGLIWSEAFGMADKAANKAATTSSLYSIASCSKMLATASVLLLVDQGRVDLDEPVVTYIPTLSMPLDPRYRDITVRMLLNHSSGLPGNGARGQVTTAPFPSYAAQVMQDFSFQRLKYAPGLLGCYNNDGFTMVENLVQAVSGQAYPEFVRQNLLAPLGMSSSRYLVEALPEGSYARAYKGETLLTQYFLNVYATGGLFSTPEDMARLSAMFLNGGMCGNRRILSEKSVRAMGQDQRMGSFNPVPCSLFTYGLGWDSVVLPGLSTVGILGWQKGGDLEGYYGANMILAPEAGLAAVVLGASNNFNSGAAGKIAERILLRALVERHWVSAMPTPLKSVSLPTQAVTQADKDTYSGIYASDTAISKLTFGTDDSLTVSAWSDTWTPTYKNLRLRSDGWFASDENSLTGVKLLTRGGRPYVALRAKYGNGHYQIQLMYGQKLEMRADLSATWQARAAETWLPVNGDNTDFLTSKLDPSVRLRTVEGLNGYLKGNVLLRAFEPERDDRLDGMFTTSPDGVRDLQDAATEAWNGETWLRMGVYLYRPLSTLPELSAGTSTLTIGSEGFTEWRQVPASSRITISGASCWSMHDADRAQLAVGTGNGSASASGAKLLALMGAKGAVITLKLE